MDEVVYACSSPIESLISLMAIFTWSTSLSKCVWVPFLDSTQAQVEDKDPRLVRFEPPWIQVYPLVIISRFLTVFSLFFFLYFLCFKEFFQRLFLLWLVISEFFFFFVIFFSIFRGLKKSCSPRVSKQDFGSSKTLLSFTIVVGGWYLYFLLDPLPSYSRILILHVVFWCPDSTYPHSFHNSSSFQGMWQLRIKCLGKFPPPLFMFPITPINN